MFTFNEFASEWQRLHHPSMDVTGDVAFFYEIYVRLHRLVDKKLVFLPIPRDELRRLPSLDQNPGWN